MQTKFRYSATLQLISGWTPQTLKDWLDEGWTCDLRRVKRSVWAMLKGGAK